MSHLHRSIRRCLVVAVALLVAATAPAAAAKGGKGGGGNGNGGGGGGGTPTAVVTLGDSYISGESGRWQGNWEGSTRDRNGTDRAAYRWKGLWFYDAGRVYGDTAASGCHRSDVAPVTWLGADVAINLACSGARTDHVISGASGGSSFKGEAPQVDQLAALAAEVDVAVVVLSIGGNDLGFADVIIDCTVEYNTSPSWWPNTCNGEQQANVDAAMPGAMVGVRQSIADIRAALAAAGDTDHRIIVQSYPSPIPAGGEFRYTESGWDRTLVGGCPFWDVDATWARTSLVPQIADALAAVAASEGVEFLDLRDALDGREVCSTSAAQGSGADAEWARFLVTGITQGEAQESMHPNALGQQAIATCLRLHIDAGPGSRSCTNVAGAGPDTMVLSGG